MNNWGKTEFQCLINLKSFNKQERNATISNTDWTTIVLRVATL